MRILIFIEHDIIIRHFVHSRIFDHLIANHEVTFVFPEAGHKRVSMDIDRQPLGAGYRRLEIHPTRQRLWKWLFLIDQLRWRPGRQAGVLRRARRQAIGWKATVLFSVFALPGIYSVFRWRTMNRLASLPNVALEALLERERPDAIIHPSVLEGEFINDLVEASRARGVPLVVIMNSWDNPSTKQAMAGHPDKLLVWGRQTWRHAVDFIGMDREDTVKFGAAQFDVYRSKPRITRSEFCRRHDIDPSAKILLYAGSSKGTDEHRHLLEIDNAIESGALRNTEVVYRPHPWGRGGYDGGRILTHPWHHVCIESTMRSYLERVTAGDTAMDFPDYHDTHDVLSSVDAVVSPLSTIILESALHGRPVLCFLPEEERNAKHFQMASPLIHFQDIYCAPEFLVARGLDELMPKLSELMSKAGDEIFAERLEKACEFFVEPFDEPYGERLTGFLEDIMAERDQAQRPRVTVGASV